MKYFGDQIKEFLTEATVIKGSKFDGDKCVRHMATEPCLTDKLCDALAAGKGNYFSWRGELITIGGSPYAMFVISDTHHTQLKEFCGRDMKKLANDVAMKYKSSSAIFKKVEALAQKCEVGQIIKDGSEFYFLKGAATDALREFESKLKRATAHALDKSSGLTPASFVVDKVFNKYTSVDSIEENFDLASCALDMFGKVNVDEINYELNHATAEKLTFDFCRKKEYKQFSKFEFSRFSSYEFETKQNAEDSKNAFAAAFTAQGLSDVAANMESINVQDLWDIGYGLKYPVCDGISIVARKKYFEICMDKSLVKQIHIFLLKYNREGVASLADAA